MTRTLIITSILIVTNSPWLFGQSLQNLDSDNGFGLIKLGTHIDTLKKYIQMDGPIGINNSVEVRYDVKYWKEYKTLNKDYLTLADIDINRWCYLYFVDDLLYRISIAFEDQSGSMQKMLNYLTNSYGKNNNPRKSWRKVWETENIRLEATLENDYQDGGDIEIFAKRFEPLPKPEKKETYPKFIKELYVSTTYQTVPQNRIWEVTGLVVNKDYVDNLVILYNDFDSYVPTSYPQLITFCDSCSVVFGQFENASINGMLNTIEDGSHPLTYLPRDFPSGYKLKTDRPELMLKIKEWETKN